ncbi:hypothetical protein [Desulfonatronum thioautotrophicum]|uniref:hypothetical protein n=1 Tax=Desulfonatronum thioautotrophicum TaxID=617001 RepID=UPI0005EBEE08|nr:hypothetical protein [Desulfonatronum thioautotrophicum]
MIGESDVNALDEAIRGVLVQDDPCWKLKGIAPESVLTSSDWLIAHPQGTYGEGVAIKDNPYSLALG